MTETLALRSITEARWLGLLCCCIGASAVALEIRSYDPEDHDRFTGFPAAPVRNLGFLYDNPAEVSRFTGVGWQVTNTQRQFALVSRQHVVFATHNTPNLNVVPALTVRFLSASGVTVDRALASKVAVVDPTTSEISDLTLITLSEPIDFAEGVEPLPYLDLGGGEPSYLGQNLVVLGWTAKGGGNQISGFEDISGIGLLPSRAMVFEYLESGIDPNEAKVQGGDSGSPSFVLSGGRAALVGTHSAIDPITIGPMVVGQTNYDTFVPHYVSSLDDLMEPLGYRMRPVNAPTTVLSAIPSTAEAVPRRGNPLTLELELANTGANLTGNLEVEFVFPAGQEPDAVSAPGWTSDGSGTSWTLRKATLDASATATLSASWAAAPLVAEVTPTLSWRSDTVATAGLSPVVPLGPSFAEWAGGLSEAGQGDDPDADGVVNLLEYAFGGDPTSGRLVEANGGPLLPRLAFEGGELALSFPEMDDKVLRGLDYVVEYSTDLTVWTTTPPTGASTSASAFSPAIPGFVERRVTWPAAGPSRFVRVGIVLAE